MHVTQLKSSVCDTTKILKSPVKIHTQPVHIEEENEIPTTPKTKTNVPPPPQQSKPKQIRKTNSKRIYCNLCDKKFNKVARYEAHVKTFHVEHQPLL